MMFTDYSMFLFLFLFYISQTQSCGFVYILQTPLICPHLGIDVSNRSTETNAIPVENVPSNGASTFWRKLILVYFKSNLNFRNYLDLAQLLCIWAARMLLSCIAIDIIHNQQTNWPISVSSNFCRSITRQNEFKFRIYLNGIWEILNCSCIVRRGGCCYSGGSCDWYLIERSGPAIPSCALVPSGRCQCSLFTGECFVLLLSYTNSQCSCVCVCVNRFRKLKISPK